MGYKLFEGIEAEGRHRGTLTLFVQDRVPITVIKNALFMKQYAQVYFGACFRGSNCTPIHFPDAVEIAQENPGRIVTIDFSGVNAFQVLPIARPYENIHFMLTVQYDNLARHAAEFMENSLHTPINSSRIQVKLRAPQATFVFRMVDVLRNDSNAIFQDTLLTLRQ